MDKKQKRMPFLSVATIISMYAVVQIHTNGVFWFYTDSRIWKTANFVECACYFAVPVFFMITGVTLINYRARYGAGEFLKKRVKKVLIPYLFWSTFGLVFRLYYLKDLSMDRINLQFLKDSYLNGTCVVLYWFFPILLLEYLVIMLLGFIPEKNRVKTFMFMIPVFVLVGAGGECYTRVSNHQFGTFTSWVITVAGYAIFCILGYLISRSAIIEDIRFRIAVYAMGFVGFLVHFAGTMYYSLQQKTVVGYFKGYMNFPSIFYAVAVFVLIIRVTQYFENVGSLKILSVIDILCKYSFAVYLLQFYAMNFCMVSLGMRMEDAVYRFLFPPVIIAACVAITWILRKLVIGRFILPE